MRVRFLLILPLLGACVPDEPPTGAEDFAAFCSSCHGAGGKGDGPMAGTLEHRPANLTRLARRNGGEFPKLRVMAKIWGYTAVSYTHLRAHETVLDLVCRLLLENKKKKTNKPDNAETTVS